MSQNLPIQPDGGPSSMSKKNENNQDYRVVVHLAQIMSQTISTDSALFLSSAVDAPYLSKGASTKRRDRPCAWNNTTVCSQATENQGGTETTREQTQGPLAGTSSSLPAMTRFDNPLTCMFHCNFISRDLMG